jgi:hypothetical protein
LFRQVVTDRATWPYSCGSVDATIFNPAFDRSVAAAHSSELRDAWLDLARSHPVTEFRHLACVSSLVWLMDESGQPPLYEFGVNVYPIDGQLNWVQNGSGLEEASMTPRLAISIGEWLEGAKKFNILWRPAGWLYLLLFATWVASRRMRDWRIATLCIPILAHSAVLALANVAQDVRYQLPVFIISLACVPALLVSRPGSSTAPARPLD